MVDKKFKKFPSSRRLAQEPPQGEEAVNAVKLDKWGQTPDEAEDELKAAFAEGTLLIRAIDDRIGAWLKGDPIKRGELEGFRKDLYEAYEILSLVTIMRVGDDMPRTDAERAIHHVYCDHYSDGTAVVTVVGSPNYSRTWSAPPDPHRSDIPWLPKQTGFFGRLPDGPRPPGCKVVVATQPALREDAAQIADQDQQHG